MNGADRPTLDFYSANAASYLAARPVHVEPALPEFLARLNPGARILELGCGGGFDAAHMLARGFDVDPTDGVPAMAAEASARLGRPVRILPFAALDAEGDYDAVVAVACLLHVPRPDLGDILLRIRRALRPGGWHLATFKTAGAEGHDEHGRYYNHVSRKAATKAYRGAGGWSLIETTQRQGVGYFSRPARWLNIVARKEG